MNNSVAKNTESEEVCFYRRCQACSLLWQTDEIITDIILSVESIHFNEETEFKIKVCLAELLNNVHIHGKSHAAVTILGWCNKSTLRILLLSEGSIYVVKDTFDADLQTTSGRGLTIVNQWATHFDYEHSNGLNITRLEFKNP